MQQTIRVVCECCHRFHDYAGEDRCRKSGKLFVPIGYHRAIFDAYKEKQLALVLVANETAA